MDSDIDEQAARLELSERLAKMMDETAVPTDDEYDYDDDSYDEDDEDDCGRPAERWAPLGAAATTPTPGATGETSHMSESERLMSLEQEQEQLNSSLLALTTHFAQVQFRLKQVTSAAPEEKEILLKELEEFAFKGIPDVRGCNMDEDTQVQEELSEKEHDAKLAEQRLKQQELIGQLKSQLEDLENYAYQTGNSNLPTNQVIEKQSAVIDQLRSKLDLKLDEFDNLSKDDLRSAVDQAIGQIVNPAKVKEKLVDQLKTQITDLERFIDFLQGEAQEPGPLGSIYSQPKCKHCDKEKKKSKKSKKAAVDDLNDKTLRDQTVEIMKQALAVLQLFAVSQFGCGGREFQKNILKRTTKANHWGDLRARLEVSLDKVIKLQHEAITNEPDDTDYASDCDEAPVIKCNQELTTAVRKELALALKDLLQHGLMEVGQSTSMVPFGCFPSRTRPPQTMMHAWDLFVKYYEMKHGREYNETPARKLSQSFGLDMVGGKAITAKQTLLSAIEEVRSKHVPLKRSEDSQFKAFVCLGLNEKRLTTWLRLVLRTPSLIEYYYQPWSYVIKTGFDDTLVSLERLSKLDFSLPVDLAIRPFSNIKDAF